MLGIAVGLTTGCGGEGATHQFCAAVLDRIIEIELREQGFRDPALVARKQADLRRRLQPDLAACVNRRVPRGAGPCLRQAGNSEEISHTCLH